MADLRVYRESTRYVYATITSATDPSTGGVWMAVVPQGIPAATSHLHEAEWVPGETWTTQRRRARLLIGPESAVGQLAAGAYRVYSKTDLGAEVPFEPEPGRLLITTESGTVNTDPHELAAVAFTGHYDDLIGTPDAGVPFLPLTGGTVTGPITWNGTPTVDGHLAPKSYVDDAVAAAGGGTSANLPLFDVEEYGAVGDGTTDDYLAIRAAWDAMLASSVGGLIYFPRAVTYRVDADVAGRLTVSVDEARALFPIPMRSRALTKLTYGLWGVGEPYAVRAADLGGTPGQVQTASVLRVDYSTPFTWSATDGLPSIVGATDADMTDSEGNTFSNVHFTVGNLIIRQPVNPSLCALNLEQCSTVRLRDVAVDVNAVLDDIPQPTHPTGAGILLPRSNNNVVVDVGHVRVEGHYIALTLTEHLRADSVVPLRCLIGLAVRRPCSHNGLVHHVKLEQCPWGISGYDPSGESPDGGVVPIPGWTGVIGFLDVEDYAYNGAAPWIYAPVEGAHINDSEGKFRGEISFFHRVNSEPPSPTGIGIGPGGGSSSLYVIGPSGTNSPIAIYGENHGVQAQRLASPNAPAVNLYRLWDAVTGPSTSAVDTGAINLGTKVQVTAAAEAVRIAFWKVADVTGAITGRLWRKDGSTYTQVGSDVTFEFDPGFEGWVFAELPEPVDLEVSTDPDVDPVYIPTVRFPNRWPFTGSYWDSGAGGSGLIAGPLRAYSNADAGGQGVFSNGLLSVPPATSGGGGGYWVDLEVRSAV